MGLLQTISNNHERLYWLHMVSCTFRGSRGIVRVTQQLWKAFRRTRATSNAFSRPKGYLFPSHPHFVCLFSILILPTTTLLPSFTTKKCYWKKTYSERPMFFSWKWVELSKLAMQFLFFHQNHWALQCF
jgi:hypothetical protein